MDRAQPRRWRTRHAAVALLCLGAYGLSCGKAPVPVSLPDSSELGNPRGLRMARVITHYHSPYSFDACDKAGLSADVPDAGCLLNLKYAVCMNRIDFLFLSDHPSEMERFEFDKLLLKEEGDALVNTAGGLPYVNRLGSCQNGFTPAIMAGFEGRLLALGMDQHAAASVADRGTLYNEETSAARAQLQSASNAVVLVPHTESRSVELIRDIQPDGIEIYNIHANLDPKIRKKDLGLKPFEHIPGILTYLVDPYKDLNADFMFLQFMEVSGIYFRKWNELIAGGLKLAGYGGTDSHENTFPQSASDGERLDSHRRLTRFMSNHLTVASLDPGTIRSALKAGKGWLVFEGLGSPVGMDLSATPASGGGTTAGPGETLSLGGGSAVIRVSLPALHRDSPRGDDEPEIRVELKRVLSGGEDAVVASASGASVELTTSQAGAYRAEVWIRPLHLRDFVSGFEELAEKEYRWVVTNHVYVEN